MLPSAESIDEKVFERHHPDPQLPVRDPFGSLRRPEGFHWEIDSSVGVELGALERTVAPLGWLQVDDVFAEAGVPGAAVDNATLEFAADARLFAYASVIDNTSGDPVYVAPFADVGTGGIPLDWGPVAAALDARVADGRLAGFAFAVRTGGPGPSFVHDGGMLSREDLVPTDSSIKPITSAVVLTLVRDGELALDDDLGSLLDWTGPEAAITVAELLAFTSGFDGSAACLSPPPSLTPDGVLLEPGDRTSLADCAAEIRAGGLIDDPGTAFHYGGSHQAVLAHAVATTLDDRFTDWDALFELQIRGRLGLSRDDIRYTNNRVAGSAVATAPGMSRVLEALAMDLGVLPRSGSLLLPPELATAFVIDRTGPGVDRSDTPWRAVPDADPAFGYGIWLECPDPARSPQGCLLFGSGARGSTSWIDVNGGYVASLVLYEDSLLGYVAGYDAMSEVAPLVREVLGR